MPVLRLLQGWGQITQMEAARRLNEMGLTTHEGRQWTTVQVRRVLRYGEQTVTDEQSTGSKRQSIRPMERSPSP